MFNREEFYESHEVFEDLWRATENEYKDLYKGLIQAAVALHHLKKGNVKGANKLFKSSTAYLSHHVPEALGLNVEKLTQDLKICFEKDPNRIPKLEIKQEI